MGGIERILAHYPAPLSVAVATFLGNHGGFSGTRLWRLAAGGADFVLRAWPVDMTTDRLAFIHAAMAQLHGLDFVPRIVPTTTGTSFVVDVETLYEVQTWLPGRADFHSSPTPARLENACRALAQMHRVWHSRMPGEGRCPGIERRLATFEAWERLVRSGWMPNYNLESFDAPAERIWKLLPWHLARTRPLLGAWRDRRGPIHPCHCDPWHDHVLFTGDAVVGVIDYGSMKIDHAAVDLARLLGSMVPQGPRGWAPGLDAYLRERRLTNAEIELVTLLDKTGVVAAGITWLTWLYVQRRSFPDRDAVCHRLADISTRLMGFTS